MKEGIFTSKDSFEESCICVQKELTRINSWLIQLRNNATVPTHHLQQNNPIDAKENILLAYRHVEDAKLRLDEAIKAFWLWTSK